MEAAREHEQPGAGAVRGTRQPPPSVRACELKPETSDPPHLPTGIRDILLLQRLVGNRAVGGLIQEWRAARAEEAAGGYPVTGAVAQAIESERARGSPVPDEVRSALETATGQTIGEPRLHHDAIADELAQAVDAHAFATGRDVFFRAGQYAPASPAGQALLAHELAHAAPRPVAQPELSQGGHVLRAATDVALAPQESVVAGGASRGPGAAGPPGPLLDSSQDLASRYQQARSSPGLQPAVALADDRFIKRARYTNPTVPPGLGPLNPAGSPHDVTKVPIWLEEFEKACADVRPVITAAVEEQMKQDVEFIVGKLKQQTLPVAEEYEILQKVMQWTQADQAFRENQWPEYKGSDHLDKFLFMLKMRTFARRTARTLWAVDEWLDAYDGLFYELEDDRLGRLKAITAFSHKEGTQKPQSEQLESVYSYVSKREALAGIGMAKGLGGIITGLTDAGLWVIWKRLTPGVQQEFIAALPKEFREMLFPKGYDKGQAPVISTLVEKSFDETAKAAAEAMDVDVNEKVLGPLSAVQIGFIGGKLIGTLVTVGAGSSQVVGKSMAEIVKKVTFAQTVASGLQAAEGVAIRIEELRSRKPPPSWSETLTDPEVCAGFASMAVGFLGSVGGVPGASEAFKQVIAKYNWPMNLAQAVPLIGKAIEDYNDPNAKPDERKAKLIINIAEILGQLGSAMLAPDDEGEAKPGKAGAAGEAGTPGPTTGEPASAPAPGGTSEAPAILPKTTARPTQPTEGAPQAVPAPTTVPEPVPAAKPAAGPQPAGEAATSPAVMERAPVSEQAATPQLPERPPAPAAETHPAPGAAQELLAVAPEAARPVAAGMPARPDTGDVPKSTLDALQQFADNHNLIIEVRPMNAAAAGALERGALPKMDILKAKTINELDVLIGAPREGVGLVGIFEPTQPPAGLPPETYKRAMERFDQRLGEYNHLHPEYQALERGGLVRSEGKLLKVFDPRTGEYKSVAGDVDIASVTHADGSPLTPAQQDAVTNKLRFEVSGVEHGALAWWERQSPKSYAPEVVAGLLAKASSAGGQPAEKLVAVVPKESPKRVWADEPVTAAARPDRPGQRGMPFSEAIEVDPSAAAKQAAASGEPAFDVDPFWREVIPPIEGATIESGTKMAVSGMAGSTAARGKDYGVFEGAIPGVAGPVAIKVMPESWGAKFEQELAAARAAALTGEGPMVYGEVNLGPGKRAFAMEKVAGAFPDFLGGRTLTQTERMLGKQQAQQAAALVTERTAKDVEQFGKDLLAQGYYYNGDVQGLISPEGRWKPIDFGPVAKLPPESDPAARDVALQRHNEDFEREAAFMRELAEDNAARATK